MSSRMQDQLPTLLALAHERSESARLQLAGKLADLLLAEAGQLTPREEAMLNELIGMLLQTNSATVRQELVRKFTDAARLPRPIAAQMIHEPIETARAILMTNETLTDTDLITVVEQESREHACAIAARREISEALADALVTTGDIKVMQIVAENLGAHLSPHAMEALAEASRLSNTLQKPILERPELTPEIAARLYWWLNQDLRRLALQRCGITAGQMDIALVKAIEEKLNEQAFRRHDVEAMREIASWLEEREALAPRLLPQLLRMGYFALFNIVVGRLIELDPHLVDITVSAAGGRMLAAVCRSMDIDKANFVSIFLLSRGARPDEQIVHPRELSHALAAYDRLTPELAQDMIRSWRENPSYLLQQHEDPVVLEAS